MCPSRWAAAYKTVTMTHRVTLGLAVLIASVAASGCGGGGAGQAVHDPFTTLPGVESGPGSGAWGDGGSGPGGLQTGCIDGRKLAVLITIHNPTKDTITLLGGVGHEKHSDIIDPVAVQVSLRPPPPNGSMAQIGLRSWTATGSPPADIPPGRDAWVQSNFLMRNCASLQSIEPLTANQRITLDYRTDDGDGEQVIPVPSAAQVILTRGPLHPTVPINQVG
jgi:hypothetical protein